MYAILEFHNMHFSALQGILLQIETIRRKESYVSYWILKC